MKLQRLFALILTLVFLAVAATGCGGGSSGNYAAGDTPAAEAPMAPAEDMANSGGMSESASTSFNTNLSADAKLIYTGEISLQATDLDAAAQAVSDLVSGYGGYIESQEVYRQSSYKSAYYTVRVPGDRFGAFISSVSESELYTVTYQSTSTKDVGETYADIENRLETLRIKLDRLQDLLSRAENMEDIITLESAISEVEYEIEYYSGEKNHYDSLIGYSTVYISLDEVGVVGDGMDSTLGQRLSSGFRRGLESFGDGCADLLVWVVSNLIGIVIFLAVAAVVITVVVRSRRGRKALRDNKTDQPKEP